MEENIEQKEVKKSNIIGVLFKSFWPLITYIAIQFVVSFFYGVKLTFDFYINKNSENAEKITEYILDNLDTNILLIISVVIMFIILLSVKLASKKSFKEFFAIKKINIKLVPLLILLGISINLIISASLTLISKIPIFESSIQEYGGQSAQLIKNNYVLNIFVLALMVPILEEIVYRVIPLNKLVPRISTIAAIIITAIVFGISHGQLIWMVYTSLFGVILAVVFLKYKSSIANIIIHSIFNLTSLITVKLPIEVEENFKVDIILLAIGIVLFILTGFLFKIFNKKEYKNIEKNGEKINEI